jgi:hypothetical protein
MFRNMRKHIKYESDVPIFELKSKSGKLDEQMKIMIDNLTKCN